MMQLEILFGDRTPLDHIEFLREQLEALPEVEAVTMEAQRPEPGKMGGFASVLLAILGTKAVSHLLDVLKTYVETSKTKITVKHGEKEVSIDSRHPEKMAAFVNDIIKNMN